MTGTKHWPLDTLGKPIGGPVLVLDGFFAAEPLPAAPQTDCCADPVCTAVGG